MDNVYISVGNKVFRQCIGIPVHPYYIANLYLFHFEYKYMRGLVICQKLEPFLTPFGILMIIPL